MIKNKIFKQGIAWVAEKSQETRRDRWAGNVNHKFLFGSVIHNHFNWVKIGFCGLYYHPSDPFLFLGFFFQQSLLKILFYITTLRFTYFQLFKQFG